MYDRCQGIDEEDKEWGQEGGACHVVEPNRDAGLQHLLGYEAEIGCTFCSHFMQTICKRFTICKKINQSFGVCFFFFDFTTSKYLHVCSHACMHKELN